MCNVEKSHIPGAGTVVHFKRADRFDSNQGLNIFNEKDQFY
jgi:hypothetical protein